MHITWTYDALGRLVSESYDAPGSHSTNDVDYTDLYTFDLASNRVKLTHYIAAGKNAGDALASGDSTTTYTYDANDRLLTEEHDVSGGSTGDTFTVYSWGTPGGNATYQTGKTIHAGLSASGDITDQTTYGYNLQGRMSSTVIETMDAAYPGADVVDRRETLTYAYNDPMAPAGLSGIRYALTNTVEADAEGRKRG